jgi:threonine/homoserine/homoserine lactone efflux protein
VRAAAVAVIAIDALVWYAALAFTFSIGPARRVYGRARRWLDRLMGGVVALFGLRLILAAR